MDSSSIVNKIDIKVNLKVAKVLSFSLTDYARELKEAVPGGLYEFTTDVRYGIRESEQSITATITIVVRTMSDKKELATIETYFLFYFENYSELAVKENQTITVETPVLMFIAQASVATTRGMLIAKLDNTIISDAVLPIIDTNNLIPEQHK